jgi:hypothetical protein
MRAGLIALALLAGACVEVETASEADAGAAAAAAGYTLEVRASESEQIFLVTSPEGRTAAARAVGEASALLGESDLQALLAVAPPSSGEAHREVVSLRLPGVNIAVSGDPEGSGENSGGRVSIDVGGHAVEVDASEGGPGDDDDRAHVLIRGVPESEAREFIAKADQLSPNVQAAMLAELGLE